MANSSTGSLIPRQVLQVFIRKNIFSRTIVLHPFYSELAYELRSQLYIRILLPIGFANPGHHALAAFMSFTGGTGGRRFINTIGRTTMTRKVNVPMYQVFRVQC